MEKSIYIRKEFIAKVSISEKTLEEWEKLKLIKPVGFTDDHTPFYSEATIERVDRIQKLLELGYGLEEIQKIIKKIGLPKTTTGKGEHTELDQYFTVGNLAERVGVSARTIKHWEDKGIIEPDMRSEGGFRLYSEVYVFLCKLIKDLQLFGYTLEEIKTISDYFREFVAIQSNFELYPKTEISRKLDIMSQEIKILFEKINLLKEGIQRWEDLLKKKRKEISNLKTRNKKRSETTEGDNNE